jgi:hydroxypyruvate reductase
MRLQIDAGLFRARERIRRHDRAGVVLAAVDAVGVAGDRRYAAETFEKLGDLVVTKPTRTNVNDFRAILVPKRV